MQRLHTGVTACGTDSKLPENEKGRRGLAFLRHIGPAGVEASRPVFPRERRGAEFLTTACARGRPRGGNFVDGGADVKAGRREYVQVLRLLETFDLDDLHAAVNAALRLGAVGFDAVKSLDSLDFQAIPALNKMQVLELARCSKASSRTAHHGGTDDPSILSSLAH